MNTLTRIVGLAAVVVGVMVGGMRARGADGTQPSTAPASSPAPVKKFHVLAFFSGTHDMAHMNFVREANWLIPKMGVKNGFTYTATNDWGDLNKEVLGRYQVVMFLDDAPRGAEQRAAFQEYMEHGGGWFGFHVCAFTTNAAKDWDWYHNRFLGSGNFHDNTWFPTVAVLKVEDGEHAAMKGVAGADGTFTTAVSEWYSWESDLRKNTNIDILASVDPKCFPLGTDPNQSWTKGYYPILWSNRKYKMIYANFGHNAMDYKADLGKSSTFASEAQNKFILNSLVWLGGK